MNNNAITADEVITSVIEWENGTISTDTHRSIKQAESVLHTLRQQGMGCDGKIFPVKTSVCISPRGDYDIELPD